MVDCLVYFALKNSAMSSHERQRQAHDRQLSNYHYTSRRKAEASCRLA